MQAALPFHGSSVSGGNTGAAESFIACAANKAALDAQTIGAHTADMRRFARRRIRDAALAEDAVQDALLAALTALDGFHGHSSPRTWLMGILAHKIQDSFRREGRYVREPAAFDRDQAAGRGRDGASDAGRSAAAWGDPVASVSYDPVERLASRRMFERFASEVEALPDSLREVFVRQAIDDEPTEAVCVALGISEANCWVRLHRARKRVSGALVDFR